MSYNGIDSYPGNKRSRRRKTHYSGVFIICMAFFAFIVIGLTISISIHACNHHKVYLIEDKKNAETISKAITTEPLEAFGIGSYYVMPNSIIRFFMPKPHEGISEQILCRTSYITSYNKDTKMANWVAWHLTANHADGPVPRDNSYYEDEDVPLPRATNEDYRGSGWSRGHMCPAGDNKWDGEAMRESNLLTNICPQHQSLNSGVWNKIEQNCRKWAKNYGDVYIVCGPVFLNQEHETIGENRIVVPEAFFKVVLCLQGNPKAIGFVIRNNEGTKKRDNYINTVDDVERITGFDFFPALPDDIEDEVESFADITQWN